MEDFSGSRMPAEVLEGGTIFSTRTRFRLGINLFAISTSNWQEEEYQSFNFFGVD